MRYPNRLYAVEGGDLRYILSAPLPSEEVMDEYARFCLERDREEAELRAEISRSLERLRSPPAPDLNPSGSAGSYLRKNPRVSGAGKGPAIGGASLSGSDGPEGAVL